MQTSSRRNVLITGSNKGIGYSIVETLLAGEKSYDFIATARNTKLGEEAVSTLTKKYPKSTSTLTFHQLDVNDDKSIADLAQWVKTKYGKLDALVNNAAIASWNTNDEEKKNIIKTNFLSVYKLTEKFTPLLSDDGKIINVSSGLGVLDVQAPTLKKALEDEKLTEQKVLDIANNILEYIKDYPGKPVPEGSYPASKALLNTYATKFLINKLKKTQQIYTVCPGLCGTDLNGLTPTKEGEEPSPFGAVRTAEKGAETPVYLINLPFEKNEELNAKFFRDLEIISYQA